MTSESLAELLDAKCIGTGRWMSKCPGHDDRQASLSIRQGRNGRTLLNCFAGCTVGSILRALGLSLRDLFAGPPPTPAELKAVAAERERAAAKQDERRASQCEDANFMRELERRLADEVQNLGRELALLPDDAPAGPALTQRFHRAKEAHRLADLAIKGDTDDQLY